MTATDLELLERFGRRIRIGLVGGGVDSVIGSTHRMGMRLDGLYELVAGAMSIDPEIALQRARGDLLAPGLSDHRGRVVAEQEANRPDGIDAVVIATPPQTYLDAAVFSSSAASMLVSARSR